MRNDDAVITIEVKALFGNLIGGTDITPAGWVKIGVVLDATAGVESKVTADVSEDQPF